MNTNTRREREILEVKRDIIKQSWKIISEEGWQCLSIRKIADAIQYSVPVIYKHFENKEAILAHFSKEGFFLLSQKMYVDTQGINDSTTQLKAIARCYWQFASEHTQHYRIMFGLGIPACEAINSSKEMLETSKYMYNAIHGILAEADNNDVDKHLKLRTFWSMLHGFIAIELLSNNTINKNPSLQVEDAIEGFIYSLIHQKN